MSHRSLSLFHIIREPKVKSDGKPPALILLHGVGSNEEDLFGLAGELDDRFSIVSVRAPIVIGPGAFGWFAIGVDNGRLIHNEEEALEGIEAVNKFVDEAIAEYEWDSGRVYLMGFSQGAIMSAGMVLFHPDKVAGAVIMSGCLLPRMMERIPMNRSETGRIPVFISHGKWDDLLPVELARSLRDTLSTLAIDIEYHEYPMGHQVSYETVEDIAAWLTKQIDIHDRFKSTQ